MSWKPLPTADGPEREPVPVGDVLDRLTAALGGRPGPAPWPRSSPRWPEVVGPAVAAHATPVSLVGGTLVVRVDQPGWATQLRYLEADLIRRLQEVVSGAVERIEVRVRP